VPDEPDTTRRDDDVLSRLWDIAHKYRRALKVGEVLPLSESEGDRRTVAPLARRLHTAAERDLDGTAYRSLAEMQVRRDSRRLLSNLPARVRLRRLGFELSLRAKPVVFLHAPGSLLPTGLLASVGYHAEDLEPDGEAEALLEQLSESENRVRMHPLDDADIERLRTRVKQRLVGQRLGRRELAQSLTSSEADLLSQLARRGEVTLVARPDGTLEILAGRPPGTPTRSVAVALRPRRQ
jgi:hypothetical protein